MSFTFISRVLDKSGLYALLLIHELLSKLLSMDIIEAHRPPPAKLGHKAERQFPTFTLWSDAGPHFRCIRFLSGLITSVCSMFKLNVTFNVGLECHMKGDVDAYFSVLDKRCKAWETERWLITPADFVECFTEAAAERLAPGLQEHFIDYLPSMTRQDFKQQCPLIQSRILPSIMTAIHSWHIQPLDIRRKTCLLKI